MSQPQKWPDGPASTELREIVAADQAARQNWQKLTPAEIEVMVAQDRERRKRVLALLAANQVKTPDDFGAAALVLQHGEIPDDFLLAHELALVKALLSGKMDSLIALAEDRFLERVRRKQRFGSQLQQRGALLVSGPFESESATAVTDFLRQDYFIPARTEVERVGYIQAMESGADAMLRRADERSNPKRPASRFVELLLRRDPELARTELLALYRNDRLETPADYRNAARLLLTGEKPDEWLLAHELAVVAAVRGDREAKRLLTEAWDRFLVALGQPQRYGTVKKAPRAPSVPPGVRERLR